MFRQAIAVEQKIRAGARKVSIRSVDGERARKWNSVSGIMRMSGCSGPKKSPSGNYAFVTMAEKGLSHAALLFPPS
jgi:hypothetical protein